jgi:hypothetical protein
MTPKEKAEELLSHYNSILINGMNHGGARAYASYICALIAVDEIIKFGNEQGIREPMMYWYKVKEELEKL